MMIKDTSFLNRPVFLKGKVRDVYDLGDRLLLITTDRMSAFDVVFNELIPDKGKVLNSISAFWFDYTKDLIPNHVITTDAAAYPDGLSQFAAELSGRSMLVHKMTMLPAECIVRGYLEGSALKSYLKDGTVNGRKLPAGLRQGDRLPEVLFTPSTKAESGHDINISVAELANRIGKEQADALERASLTLYHAASAYAESKGILLADSKFEFGLLDGRLTVGDELFTPDSSRFWDLETWKPGGPQQSFDKQFLREWLEGLDWDKNPPPPSLPQEIIQKTASRYREAYSRLTGLDIQSEHA